MKEIIYVFFFFFKQKTAYEMRISDWSSDVCSSDLQEREQRRPDAEYRKQQPPDEQADRYAVHGDREWQRNVEMGVAAGRQRDAVAETVRDQPQHGQQQGGEVGFAPRPADALFEQRRSEQTDAQEQRAPPAPGAERAGHRSEERRVGKEGVSQ